MPLYYGEQKLGRLVAGWKQRREVSSRELALLELLGNEAALALARVQLTERLQASEARYRSLFENANDVIITLLAHDIRNPLTAILGYLDILSEETAGRRSVAEDDFLQRLKDNALTIHSLMANYLDLAKVETGSLVLHKAPQVLEPLLRRVVEQYAAVARRRRLTLALELPAHELPQLGCNRTEPSSAPL